jgi:FKBP-type peptidyl-prolyl cis-trans isomerase FklB
MKPSIFTFVVLSLAVPLFAEDKAPPLNDAKDKASYSIGINIGQNLKRQGVELNPDAMIAGLKDGLGGKKSALTDDQIKEAMTTLEKDMEQKQEVAAQKNVAQGEKFLADNKTKPATTTTASGLQYKVEKEGNGAQPKPSDTVTVNYRGTLVDGTEFDSSYKRNEPAQFPLNQVIPCWTEGVQKMKVGGKAELVCPASIAYGDSGSPPTIPGGATLIFEVELMRIGG